MEPQREWFEKDYYKTLGLSDKADDAEITKAYRKLAKKLHPDANPGDKAAEERFKEVASAYDVLGDSAKRESYDEVRRLGPMAGGFGPSAHNTGGFNINLDQMGDLGGFLGNLFGRGARSRGGAGPGGEDLETELHLDFVDAVAGTTVTVPVVGEAMCRECAGSGSQPPSQPSKCPKCDGSGMIAENQGMFSFSRPCHSCGGRGAVITDPCKTCRGRGVEHRQREVKARIPAGVADGQRIRLKGRGAPGNGRRPGDLYVNVKVRSHEVFGRQGKNLTLTVPVTFAEAALGADVKLPTLDGETVTIRIPAGSSTGKRLRVRGSPATAGADIIAVVEVVVPEHLSDEQRAAIEALAAAATDNPRAHLGV